MQDRLPEPPKDQADHSAPHGLSMSQHVSAVSKAGRCRQVAIVNAIPISSDTNVLLHGLHEDGPKRSQVVPSHASTTVKSFPSSNNEQNEQNFTATGLRVSSLREWGIRSIDLAVHQAGFVAEFDVPGAERKGQATMVSSQSFQKLVDSCQNT